MPPRRRGNSTTARAAAIEAVQAKRLAQQQASSSSSSPHDGEDGGGDDEEDMSDFESDEEECQHPHHHRHNHNRDHNHNNNNRQLQPYNNNNNNNNNHSESESEYGGIEDDSPPPLVDNDDDGGDDEFFEGVDDDDEEEDEEDDEDAVGSAGAHSSSNTNMSGEGGCLHCHKSASNSDIQVRCDECQGYICQGCHWCHEFQANHEIRVCDRCDAFYCRTCDEMDQCDDCGEVVCASCSTLLSCKFCGGGLCEECATACGRCGIVLCSRDAKFAVDCDTCRLSYCLVCLASGSKDPCVRCGHRPSKRMEQLVHLRLKSIYKAFKQSSRNSKYGNGEGGEDDDDENHDDMDDDDDDDDDDMDIGKSGDPQSLLQAAASAASKHSGGRSRSNHSNQHSHHHHSHHHHSSSHHVGEPSTTSKSGAGVGASGGNSLSRDQHAKDMVDKYMAEKEKADAAAAALLAELEGEEEAVISKKNKKKRKKDREKAKKEEEQVKLEPSRSAPSAQQQQQKEDDDSDIDFNDIAKPSSTATKGGKAGKKKKKKNQKAETTEDDKVNAAKPMEVDNTAPPNQKAGEPGVDLIEQQLCEYVADSNYVGIEDILTTLKGVPGRALLRKNAKKALKKIKLEQIAIEEEAFAIIEAERARKKAAEDEMRKKESEKMAKDQQLALARSGGGAATPAIHSETTNSSSGRHQPPPPLPPNELLRIVSHTQGSSSATPSSTHRAQRKQAPSTSAAAAATKAECVMHLAYNVVGWVIGKGGQRIRDLMEDSGAKVWIDQEHLSTTDPRIVYVSGNRKSVESAVKMIKELVSKAPGAPVMITEPVAGTALTPTAAPPATSSHFPTLAKAGAMGGSENFLTASSLNVNVPGGGITANPFESHAKALPVPRQGQPAGSMPDSFFYENNPSVPTHRADIYAQEITCEACFVPLLIGRRGWTIKHIQDSSGARVDIDQTVTPRKVKISGREENVKTAIRMVRDVLSYPHAQLQGAADSLEELDHPSGMPGSMDQIAAQSRHLESAAATLSNTTTVAASNQMLDPAMHASPAVVTQSAAVERAHTPPPSSHINIPDAKSTVSASSSLSSTPEPSMASTVKGHYGFLGTPGPLVSPDYGGAYAQHHANLPNSNLFGQQTNLQQMNLGNIPDHRGGPVGGVLPSLQQAAPSLFPSGIPTGSSMQPPSPRFDVSPGLQRGFSQQQQHLQHLQQQQRQQELLGQSMLQDQMQQQQQQQQQQQYSAAKMNSGIPQQSPHYQARSDTLPNVHHSSSMPFPSEVSQQQQQQQQQQQNQMNLIQQNAFHMSEQKPPLHSALPEMSIGNLNRPDLEGLNTNSAAFVPPAMWNSGSSASVDNFQHRNQLLGPGGQQQSLGYGLAGASIASQEPRLSGGVEPALKPQSKDDAQLVDSLFGPSEPIAVSKEKDSILTSFTGLSLNNGIASDMWTNPQGSSGLLSSLQPDLSAEDVTHPSRSRFGWGTNETQGQSS